MPAAPRAGTLADRLLRLLANRRSVAIVAAVSAVGIVGLRAVHDDAADATAVLLVVPIALVALVFGLGAGLAGAAAATVYVTALNLGDPAVGIVGHLSRAAAFLLVGFLVGLYADERRRLAREIERYYELSLDLLAVADLEGRFLRVNPAWTRVLGYEESELCSRPYFEFLHPDDLETTKEVAADLESDEATTTRFRNRYRHADGSYRWLEWASRTFGDRIYGAARDVTDTVAFEEALAGQAQLLERQVRERTAELEAAHAETLERLARAAEYRDDDTRQHTERVGALAAALATELGWGRADVELMRRAAPLHDIGKLGIPDRVLLKRGRLGPEERELMRRHVQIGIAILAGSTSPVLRLAEEIVRSHHEWWDGSGHPEGLAGEAIPLSGRIVALADVFDALTHARPYKQGWPVERAVAEIRRLAGTQFDPAVVAAFEHVRQHGAAELSAAS